MDCREFYPHIRRRGRIFWYLLLVGRGPEEVMGTGDDSRLISRTS